jgi:hypothetical protein
VDLRKVGKNTLDEIHGVGPLRVPREFSLDPRWIRRFGDYLCLVKICCLFGHETFDRLCQRGKPAAWPLNLSISGLYRFRNSEGREMPGGSLPQGSPNVIARLDQEAELGKCAP